MTGTNLDLADHVAIVAGLETEWAGAIGKSLEQHGARVRLAIPPTTRDEAEAAVADCVNRYGHLDIVIHAGWPRLGASLLDATDDELLAAWRDVVVSSFSLTQAALPRLAARRYGRIVLVTDGAGLLYGHDELAAYDMAMGAATAMMRTLAAEAPADGVATNAVLAVPGRSDVTAVAARDPAVVAAATWLASRRCDVSGRFFAVGQGRMAEIFTCAGRGFQSADPTRFSIEEVRDHWSVALSLGGSIAPVDQVAYNAFRTTVYQATVR